MGIDGRDYLQPIITPFELEIACGKGTQWSGKLVTDYRDLLVENPDSDKNVENEDSDDSDDEGDISLITGKIRNSCKTVSNEESALSVINDKTISLLHEGGGVDWNKSSDKHLFPKLLREGWALQLVMKGRDKSKPSQDFFSSYTFRLEIIATIKFFIYFFKYM